MLVSARRKCHPQSSSASLSILPSTSRTFQKAITPEHRGAAPLGGTLTEADQEFLQVFIAYEITRRTPIGPRVGARSH